MKKDMKDLFNKFVEDQPSKLLKNIDYRQSNKQWLDESARIALMVLNALKARGMSQKYLADQMGTTPQYISKIVKGSENLTLETIKKLEQMLGLVILSKSDSTYELVVVKEYISTSMIEAQKILTSKTTPIVFEAHAHKTAKEFSVIKNTVSAA